MVFLHGLHGLKWLKSFQFFTCVTEEKVYERKLQQAHDSYIMTVPRSMVLHLGAKVGKSLTFRPLPDMVVLTLSGKDLTKKDLAEIDKYRKALRVALGREKKEQSESKEESEVSTLEELRLK